MAFKKINKLFPKNKKFELDLSIYKNSLNFSFTTKKKHRCILLIGGYRNISYLWNVFKNKLNSHDVYHYAPKTHSKGKSYFQSGMIEFNGLWANDKCIKGKSYWDINLKLKFDGEYNSQGKYAGNGKLYYNNPDNSIEYHGNFQYGKYNGQGILYFQNGNIDYQGGWIDHKRNGDGTSHYESTGNIEYLGQWANDERHGTGILYDESGIENKVVKLLFY